MRLIADLVMTTSFSAAYSPSRLALPDQARAPAACAPRSPCRRPGPPRAPGSISSSVVAVRKPSPPRLTPRIGTPRSPTARAMDSSVPSPPSTTRRSTCPGSSALLAGLHRAPTGRARRSPSPGPASSPCAASHSQDLRMTRGAAGRVGLGDRARRGSRKRLHHLCSMRVSRFAAVRPWAARCRKNSRLPLGPRSGEAVTPRTCQPRSTA